MLGHMRPCAIKPFVQAPEVDSLVAFLRGEPPRLRVFPGQVKVNGTREFSSEDGNRLKGVESTIEDGVDILAGKHAHRFHSKFTEMAQDALYGTFLFGGEEVTGNLPEATAAEPLVGLGLRSMQHQVA